MARAWDFLDPIGSAFRFTEDFKASVPPPAKDQAQTSLVPDLTDSMLQKRRKQNLFSVGFGSGLSSTFLGGPQGSLAKKASFLAEQDAQGADIQRRVEMAKFAGF